VGENKISVINNSYSTGSVWGTGERVGGLVGSNEGASINNSYSTSSVSGAGESVGGLVGSNSESSTVNNSYSTGSVFGAESNVGGLVGENCSSSSISNSYSTGSVFGTDNSIGGLVGANIYSSTVTNSFWNTDIYPTDNGIGTGLNTTEMQDLCTYLNADWDFAVEIINGTNDYWVINSAENGAYPALTWQGIAHTGVCCGVTHPIYNETDALTICDNELPYAFGTQSLIAEGDYTELFQSISGCDSTVVLTLTVNPTFNETDIATICDNETFTFGTQTLDASNAGENTEVFQSVSGCDSTVVLTLTVNPTYNLTEAVSICPGESYTFPDMTTQNNITAQVIHTSNFTTENMCDSLIITTVDVNPVYNLTETVAICPGESYTFPDGTIQDNITTQIIYTSNLSTILSSCDSIIITTVDVNPVYNLTETVEVCSGDSYTFPDGTTQDDLTAQVIYTSNLQTVETSCDSIIITTINVNTVNTTVNQNLATLTAEATGVEYQWVNCDNEFIEIDGETNQMFVATINGSYAVEITDGDCSAISDCFDVTTILIEDSKFKSSITAFPNPTNGLVNIDLGNSHNEISAIITDAQGRVIKDFSFSNTQSFDLDFKGLPGVYFVLITADSKTANLRLIKE
jgi:hypothetical protein